MGFIDACGKTAQKHGKPELALVPQR